MTRLRFVITCKLMAVVCAPAALADSRSIETRPGVKVPIELDVPNGAPALVLLFEGGGGKISGRGFASSVHESLIEAGIGAVSVGAPSDQGNFMGGMHPRFRASEQHMSDIDTILRSVKDDYDLPVWVFGVSIGSRSVALYGTRRTQQIDGVILASSTTRPPRGKGVHEFPLSNIRVPVLAVAHEDDPCPGTPASGARQIVDAATASPKAEFKIFSGGSDQAKNPCFTGGYHTFNGIQREVGEAIADFIKANTR